MQKDESEAGIIKARKENDEVSKILQGKKIKAKKKELRFQVFGEKRKPCTQVDVQTPNQSALHPLTPQSRVV